MPMSFRLQGNFLTQGNFMILIANPEMRLYIIQMHSKSFTEISKRILLMQCNFLVTRLYIIQMHSKSFRVVSKPMVLKWLNDVLNHTTNDKGYSIDNSKNTQHIISKSMASAA